MKQTRPALASLNRRLTILRQQDGGRDATGGPIEGGWTTHKTIWGSCRAVRGDEGESAGRERATQTCMATIRRGAGADILHTDRLRVDGTDFDIKAIDDRHGDRVWLTLICERIVT